MNKGLLSFLKVGNEILKTMMPQIAIAENSIVGIAKGADKKKSVIDAVMIAPVIAELIKGKELVDEKLFQEGVSDINDGLVKVMKAFKQTA